MAGAGSRGCCRRWRAPTGRRCAARGGSFRRPPPAFMHSPRCASVVRPPRRVARGATPPALASRLRLPHRHKCYKGKLRGKAALSALLLVWVPLRLLSAPSSRLSPSRGAFSTRAPSIHYRSSVTPRGAPRRARSLQIAV